MKITKRVAATAAAGVLSVTGLALVVAPLASAAPAPSGTVSLVAPTATDDAPTATDDGATPDGGKGEVSATRLQALKDALAGLVTDGTITQAQADAVASTLEASAALRGHGPGHGGFHLDVAAEALGVTAAELRTALEVEGTTLADVAADQGVETSVLVDALVAAGTERISAAVTDGRLTQAEADAEIAALPERIGTLIEQEPGLRGPGMHGGRGLEPNV